MSWFKTKADEDAPAKTPAHPTSSPMAPLQDLDKSRQPPPANPTGIPNTKPMSMSELLRLLEMASKALLDSGLDMEKSAACLQKVKSMGGVSESEREIIKKTEELANKVTGLKDQVSALSMAVASYRESLTSKAPSAAGSKGWWAKK